MKGYTKEVLTRSRPHMSAEEAVDFCLDALFDDKVHKLEEEVVSCLTYEELTGALLLAKDYIAVCERECEGE